MDQDAARTSLKLPSSSHRLHCNILACHVPYICLNPCHVLDIPLTVFTATVRPFQVPANPNRSSCINSSETHNKPDRMHAQQ
eukprot:1161295-Pelagomonas_calceolata.AAC.7